MCVECAFKEGSLYAAVLPQFPRSRGPIGLPGAAWARGASTTQGPLTRGPWGLVTYSGLGGPRSGGTGVQSVPYQEGSWAEKSWHVFCCYSHDVSGEQALQREVVIETKPSRDGLVE